jgi:hypothetical protein
MQGMSKRPGTKPKGDRSGETVVGTSPKHQTAGEIFVSCELIKQYQGKASRISGQSFVLLSTNCFQEQCICW